MSDLTRFPWPDPSGQTVTPRWNGRDFEVNGRRCRVLEYQAEASHWSEDLTSLHEQEGGSDHPIDIASRRLAVASMRLIGVSRPVIIDVGCSSGFVLEEIRREIPSAQLIGSDYLAGPLRGLAQRIPDIPLVQFDLRNCPFPDSCVDGVTCLNVLEHIDDHEKALREIHRLLRTGGIAHIEVPAGPHLYDIYDEHLMHHRRYLLSELLELARIYGFEVIRATHLGFLPYPAFYIAKRRNKKMLSRTTQEKAQIVAQQIRHTRRSRVLSTLIKLEMMLSNRMPFPFGIRCVAVLRK